MSIRLADLVDLLGGELKGDAQVQIAGIAPLTEATATQISFLSNAKMRVHATQSLAAALILNQADDAAIGDRFIGARIVTDNPYVYFARTAQWFASQSAAPIVPGIDVSAVVDPAASIAASARIGAHVTIDAGAVIDPDVRIDAGCYIGRNAHIGAGSHLHARVVFEADCRIGRNGIVHSGAVIGADGFGFANDGGVWIKIPQTGGVSIGDDVEIGANTCIDRGAMRDTVIENGVKLDNQIQIGHNCHIGAHTAMAGCVGVAGSTTIGKYCTIGGAAMIVGHITIADRVHISAATMVSHAIHVPGQYTGFFPIAKNADWEKSAVIVRNLVSMREKIRQLEKTVKLLSEKNQNE